MITFLTLLILAVVIYATFEQHKFNSNVSQVIERLVESSEVSGTVPIGPSRLTRDEALARILILLKSIHGEKASADTEELASVLDKFHRNLMALDDFRGRFDTLRPDQQANLFYDPKFVKQELHAPLFYLTHDIFPQKVTPPEFFSVTRDLTSSTSKLINDLITQEESIHDDWKRGIDSRPNWRKRRHRYYLSLNRGLAIVRYGDQSELERLKTLSVEEYKSFFHSKYRHLNPRRDACEFLDERKVWSLFEPPIWSRWLDRIRKYRGTGTKDERLLWECMEISKQILTERIKELGIDKKVEGQPNIPAATELNHGTEAIKPSI